MFTQLSNEETKKLEWNSNDIQMYMKPGKDKFNNKLFLLTGWTRTHDLDVNKQRIKTKKLIELLGFKQNYCVTYEYKNYVWGFQFGDNENNKVVIYSSQKGLSVQLNINFDINEIENLLDFISSLLVNYNNIPEMMKFLVEE